MSISETCIRRPVLTTLITASMIVFGIFAYRLLAVAALPTVDYPTISITATLPGASPETMAASVASPIERQLSTISGISSMTSMSSLGTTQITIQFDLGRDIDGAALDVQTALSVAQRRLPVEMTTPPSFRKVNPGDFPILYISLVSPTLPLSTINDYGEITLAQQISQIPGVAQVLVYGAQRFAVRVQVDPVAAAARNISLEDIRNVVSKTNSNTPVGTISGTEQNITLTATAAMTRAAEYRKVVVAFRNGTPVKLADVARVVDSVENDRIASYFNNERAIVLAIQRQPAANTVAVVDAVRERLPGYRAQIPAAIRMEVLNDRSVSIREAVYDVQETLAIAIGLVVLVIFLFLRTLPATLIPALAVPISLIGTFAVMYALGFSINNMTMLALTLSVGFVVDDAIVMLENIVRHIEGGMRPFEAALKGAREIGFTIVSITFSLIAVFIPVLLMGGLVGRVFREFAVTIAVAILISGFVSLTLTPMLCARVLRGHHGNEKQNPVLRLFERGFAGMLRGYEVTLDLVLRNKPVVLVATLATMIGTVWLYIVIPKGFFPIEDTGFISATVEGPADISFKAMSERQRAIAEIVRSDPAVAYVNSTVGVGGPNPTPNYGRMFIALKPKKERGENATAVIQRLRRETGKVVGMATYFQNVQNINITGRISKSEFQYTLQSSDTEALYRAAPELREKIATLPGLRDVTTDLYISNPQMTVEIDRERAAFYGISVEQVRQELFNAFGTRQVATIYTPSNDYQVILESLPEFQADPSGLERIFLKTNTTGAAGSTITPGGGVTGNTAANGPSIPLSAVTRIVRTVGPLQVNHQGQQPAVTISFNLAPGFSLGQAVDAIREIERESNLPASIATGFQGSAQVFQDSLRGQGVLVLAAIFAAYVVLGILYESFIHPVTIISGLPSAGVGALLILMAFDMELSVIAMIGIVMLVGIVKKNAIMMIDFAIERRRVGLGAEAAMREACLLRFRPIMMTTFAAIFGALPIALGTGAGAELRQPLGIAVVGGLAFSQLLTLYITPVIYIYLDRVDRRLKKRLEPQLQTVGEGERAPVAAE
ncbi:efflux RND transporter permease subunit [Rhodoplanes sp. TEM]|uniref:Efflux RND transporter permease subunit n=1 Tax=Rhodoplanes tepidamans TaxID=200616 RepID=A0ABT5JBG8_RHOTP|nr:MULTISPECIES: efflux RND transporter permease subunit [Rhodoplanes]MDC7786974.1 efflux RND transporter permease subunit [Rhodoplanes tepidamans]MDC7985035.1 efflux RND transporter permease subunit [Rhodoplanes sp. TEM]MDQ0355329.1 HAE1 family hydrophobic/amphiphilic exporter-1 [Rhodoplanes tepidamans]